MVTLTFYHEILSILTLHCNCHIFDSFRAYSVVDAEPFPSPSCGVSLLPACLPPSFGGDGGKKTSALRSFFECLGRFDARFARVIMASDALHASAAAASDEEAQSKLTTVCLSLSTDRSELWRANGITFRPYRDERDLVGQL